MPGDHTAVCAERNGGSHHPFVCDLNRDGPLVIYETMGCREVSVELPACVAQGDEERRYVSPWAPRSGLPV